MHLSLSLPLTIISLLPVLLSLLPASHAAADNKAAPKPCTIHSPSTGSYFDLRPLDLSPQPTPPSKSKRAETPRNDSWHARGYDYPANFTLNFCGPVIETLKDVAGIPSSRWHNVSAFYKIGDETYSIGQSNSELVFRGRKLLLNYTGGSPCPEHDEDGNPIKRRSGHQLHNRKIIDDDDDNGHHPSKGKSAIRRKSTLLSLLCDRDPTLSSHPAISFLGTPDHCTYVFEARSRYFCGGASSAGEPGSLGPGGVFGVILLITLLAYLVGGCAYQRIVMRQRGWRQCPNWGVWAGIGEAVKDIFTILFSTCTRYTPSFSRAFNSRSRGGGGGYHRVGEDGIGIGNGGGNGNDRRRGGGAAKGRRSGGRDDGRVPDLLEDDGEGGDGDGHGADANRLIDQLDEEWDD